MIKKTELKDPTSCLNKALPHEMLFVVLARDPSAPAAIEAWVKDRIKRGLNKPDDAQIKEAIQCVAHMVDMQFSIRTEVDRNKEKSFSAKFAEAKNG